MKNDETWIDGPLARNERVAKGKKLYSQGVVDTRHLSALFEQTALGILYIELDRNVDNEWYWGPCNQRFCEMVGYTQEELRTTPIQDLVWSEDLSMWYTALDQLRTNLQSSMSCSIRLVHKNRTLLAIHILLSSTPPVSSLERDRAMLVGFVDSVVTVQNEAPHALTVDASQQMTTPEIVFANTQAQSKEYMPEGSRTWQTIHGLLKIAELLLQLPTANDELRALGLELVELVGGVSNCQHIGMYIVASETQLLHPLVVPGAGEDEERAGSQERASQGVPLQQFLPLPGFEQILQNRVMVIDKDHPAFAYFASSHPTHTVLLAAMLIGERLVGFITLNHGSVRHTYEPDEIALVDAVATLGALVIDRQRLQEERVEAQGHVIALREANRRMEDFLGIASHELRTPLTTIKANIQLAMRRLKSLLQQPEDLSGGAITKVEAAHDMLFRAEWQVGVLNRLVSDLIDISRIQTGRLQLYVRQEPCNVVQIIRNSIAEQRKASPERIIDMSLPDEEQMLVMADPDRIGQVLTNYISNALKYSEINKPMLVTLSYEQLAAGAPGIKVSVKDEGAGLPEDEQERIWECFYQSQSVRVLSGSGVGLGLGLYISQMIIERHGGCVGVSSQQGKGSTFWFTLPLAQVKS